jgi:hypothetical protein
MGIIEKTDPLAKGERPEIDHTPTDKPIIGPTNRDTAVCLLAAGLWPIPNRPDGKAPIRKGWGDEQENPDSIRKTFRDTPKAGIGVGLGPGRGAGGTWLVDVEGDGPEAEESRIRLFDAETPGTLGWGSARGGHQLFIADTARLTGLVAGLAGRKDLVVKGDGKGPGVFHLPEYPGLELRVGGYHPGGKVKQFQSVVPPTVGTDGKPRQWNGVSTIAPLPESVYSALRAAAAPARANTPAERQEAATATTTATNSKPADRVEVYLKGALSRAAGKVATAAEGNRHPTLLAETRCLAGFLWCGKGYGETELYDTMLAAANRAAPGRASNAGTVKDAIGYGKEAPLPLPPDLHALATGAKPTNGHTTAAAAVAVSTEQEAPVILEGWDTATEDRPTIRVTADFHVAVFHAAQAIARHPDVYTRTGELARVIRHPGSDPDEKGIHRAAGSPVIVPMDSDTARVWLSMAARFERFDARDKDWRTIPPSRDIAGSVLGLRSYPDGRELVGVVESPTLRPDGSLIETPGFDRATGLLYLPNADFPAVPDHPTEGDARNAVALILRLVTDFPFASDCDRAAWLAYLLTVIVRSAIEGPVPLFLFSSNVAGIGKSTLAEMAGLIATGRHPALDDYSQDNIEMEKRLTALAIAGDRSINFDNAENGSRIGCSALDRAITARGAFRGRILGSSKMSGNDIPWSAVVSVTAPGHPLLSQVGHGQARRA